MIGLRTRGFSLKIMGNVGMLWEAGAGIMLWSTPNPSVLWVVYSQHA